MVKLYPGQVSHECHYDGPDNGENIPVPDPVKPIMNLDLVDDWVRVW